MKQVSTEMLKELCNAQNTCISKILRTSIQYVKAHFVCHGGGAPA